MKRLFLFSILLFFTFPCFAAGQVKKSIPPPAKENKKSVASPGTPPEASGKEKKKPIPTKPLPPEKKTLEEEFSSKLPDLIDSISRSAPPAAGLWKEELRKDPLSFLKRVLETEKSGIRVQSATLSRKRERPSAHLFYCRECRKKFKTPPLFHAHRIRDNILLIKINKWDKATYAHTGRLLKMAAAKSSLLLWDLRDCRGDSAVSVTNILAHLKKYKTPSALLLSRRTGGSGELFAKCLQKQDPHILSAGSRTSGLPFLMKKKEFSLVLENGKRKLVFALLLPRIPPRFSNMDCAPVIPGIKADLSSYYGKGKDLVLHHLCDLFLAGRILEKGRK